MATNLKQRFNSNWRKTPILLVCTFLVDFYSALDNWRNFGPLLWWRHVGRRNWQEQLLHDGNQPHGADHRPSNMWHPMDDDGGIYRHLLCWNVRHRILSVKSNISHLCALHTPGHACNIRYQLYEAENFQVFVPLIHQNQRITRWATAYFSRSTRRRDHS